MKIYYTRNSRNSNNSPCHIVDNAIKREQENCVHKSYYIIISAKMSALNIRKCVPFYLPYPTIKNGSNAVLTVFFDYIFENRKLC